MMRATANAFLIVSIVSSVVGLATVFVGIPWLRRSAYRYELWRIRDQLWDGIHGGAFDAADVAQTLLERIELDIRRAPDITMSAALAAMVATRGERSFPGLAGERSHKALDAAVEAADDARLTTLHQRYERAVTRYLLTGSITGWAIAVPVVLCSMANGFGRLVSGEVSEAVSTRKPAADTPLHDFVMAAAGAPIGKTRLALQDCF